MVVNPKLLLKANNHAQMSCTRWNKKDGKLGKMSRKYHRQRYRALARRTCASPEHQRRVARYEQGDYEINTYPWPYCDPGFAHWDESDDKDNYSLISDPSGFVVRYSTSYVAYKIYEYTGRWPKRQAKGRYNAWDWLEFLRQAGYSHVTTCLVDGERYVGVLRKTPYLEKSYEWGLVVWAEQITVNKSEVKVTTYANKKFTTLAVNPASYTWVKIPRLGTENSLFGC